MLGGHVRSAAVALPGDGLVRLDRPLPPEVGRRVMSRVSTALFGRDVMVPCSRPGDSGSVASDDPQSGSLRIGSTRQMALFGNVHRPIAGLDRAANACWYLFLSNNYRGDLS